MRGSRQVRRARRQGSTIVESAFIFTVLALMLLGIFDFGRVLFIHQALVERVRSAARWAVVNNPDATTAIKNKVVYNTPTAGSSGYFGLTPSMVTVSHVGANTNDNRLTVAIQGYQYRTITPFFARNYTGPKIQVTLALGIFN